MVQRFFVSILIMLAFSASAVAQAGGSLVRVNDVRFGDGKDATRVVIEADAPIDYEYFMLANGERRVVIEMPRVRWSVGGLTTEAGSGNGDGVVRQFRYGHNSPSTSRLVLDLSEPADIVKSFRLPPKKGQAGHRVVLDLKSVSAIKFREKAEMIGTEKRKKERRKKRKPLIMIDAGHGGKDPGAISKRGTREKDITLSSALALSDLLKKTGRYEVAMTRSADVFIELEDRVTLAREIQADLFISLHADAGSKPETRGASIYTLSSSGEKRAKKMRVSQNWVLDVEQDESRSQVVNDILVDLVETETKNESMRFANELIPEINRAKWPALRRTHRDAGFFVLLSPDVPAVLLEMGFLTNTSDEKLLTNSRHRRKLLKAVVRGIDNFFEDKELYVAQR